MAAPCRRRLGALDDGQLGFTGTLPAESVAEENAWTIAGVLAGDPPDVLTTPDQRVVQPTLNDR